MKAGIRNSSSVALLLLILFSCGEQKYISITGKTMGTYYAIQYQGDENYQTEIDSIFQTFISAASTYDTTSELSEFNRKGIVHFRTPYLYRMLSEARRINEETHGAFEPTLFPLISAHGFGPSRRNIATQPTIDSLLSLVSINYIEFDSVKLSALKKGVQLDLNAMGEGFAIELIADFLERNNVHSYKVEIGGEMKCRGTNPGNELWLIGIEDPSPNGRHITKTVRLRNESISTSGSYRNFHKDSTGRRQCHLIDPKTGYPVQNNLLSVTIKTNNAINADAYATACMIMGFEDAVRFIEHSNADALITYEENGSIHSWNTAQFFNTDNVLAATN